MFNFLSSWSSLTSTLCFLQAYTYITSDVTNSGLHFIVCVATSDVKIQGAIFGPKILFKLGRQ